MLIYSHEPLEQTESLLLIHLHRTYPFQCNLSSNYFFFHFAQIWLIRLKVSLFLCVYVSVVGSFHHGIPGVFGKQRVGSSGCHPPLLPAMSFALWQQQLSLTRSSQPALTLAMVPSFVSAPHPPSGTLGGPRELGSEEIGRLDCCGFAGRGVVCFVRVVCGQTHVCIHAVWWGCADNG